jgi:hypothetical protein
MKVVQPMLELLHKKMIQEVREYAIIQMDTDGNILNWKGVEKIKRYKIAGSFIYRETGRQVCRKNYWNLQKRKVRRGTSAVVSGRRAPSFGEAYASQRCMMMTAK